VKERNDSWSEEEFQPKTPPTPPTPEEPVRDTRPLADIDQQEKVSNQVLYEGMKTPPKVTKRKVAKKAVAKGVVEESEEV
jgi:hypothetical protein